MPVSAKYSNRSTLLVQGDDLSNTVDVSRNAAGTLLVNGGAIPVVGGPATIVNTRLIQIFGAGGDDTLSINESLGALPKAYLSGGDGNDRLLGGSRDDLLLGDAGDDILLGMGGVDLLHGGDGNDVLVGGGGDDFVNGNAGDDRLVWNPGDGSDVFEGGTGTDIAEVNGGSGGEVFTLTANVDRVRIDRVTPAPFAIDAGTMEQIVVNMNGGDDGFSVVGSLAGLVSVAVDGGPGNDSILGSTGADVLRGGDDDDFIDGQQGTDTVALGSGNDVFQWDPGDGSDVVDGDSGTDTLLFNGSNIGENISVSSGGGRVAFFRDIANVLMDLGGIEVIDFKALGGADRIAVGDLTGAGVTRLDIRLAASAGGGDGADDTVNLQGSAGNDVVDIVGAGTTLSVIGLAALVNVTDSEGANDALSLAGGAGNDTLRATTLSAGLTTLTLDGGDGDDTVLGSQGPDILLGGADNDFVLGDNGNDVAFLGTGDDVFQWQPGDGSDIVEGQGGNDALLFFGSNVGETINITANGGRTLFSRDVAAVTMDLDEVERVEFRALGGTDNIVIGDLTGTDTTRVDIDLSGSGGAADASLDSVTVNATAGDDSFGVTGNSGGISVFGLQAQVILSFADASDRLVLNGQGGNDIINASGLQAGAVQLTMNGGQGNDLLLGSQGGDLVSGGAGNDTALMGPGDDTFAWNPGDSNDVVEGQGGADTLLFNGSNIGENIAISANGGRALFTRDIANVVMDINGIETITCNALGGADRIVVNDLSGTGVTAVDINLAASGGGGDGAADTVTINASAGADVVVVVGDGGSVTVTGLSASVRIVGFEAGVDRLVINLLGGDDVLEASALQATGLLLTGNGGDDNDVLVGGDGPDTLNGGPGDDVLVGGPGIDILDGGPGNNVVIQVIGVSSDPMVFF